MKVTEIRIVRQDWYETEYTKTGWDSHGWYFDDGNFDDSWTITKILDTDKFEHPTVAIVERDATIY